MGIGPFDALPVDKSKPVARSRQAGADIKECAFATTAWADERDHLAIMHSKAHAADRRERAAVIASRKAHRHIAIFEADNRHEKFDRQSGSSLAVWADCASVAA